MAASSAAQAVNRAVQKLFIGNIPWTVGRRELREYFSQYGHVTFANVLFDKVSGMSKGYGFIQYSNREGYSNATGKDSHFLEGGQLIVEQTGGGGGGGGQFDRASGRRGFTNKVDQFDLQNVMNKS
ncbi:PREDICTED: SRA stem-loop-interacting RNA-binding protein, mitochondrial-like [Priapulus caudatus]|uniref:SRA stem-loop-interacting RNA-binding protein, mitochondrial-like n=1 Tax=Priapulus caudatus TaxID=37621 RepID=A0ABM1E697_PRICU|nr:PREDICTED: SRA stem-loop-interacting RNA-binding protein, mitochondrial-like [Priapulus caudatus]